MYSIKKYRQLIKYIQDIKYGIYLYYIRYNINIEQNQVMI